MANIEEIHEAEASLINPCTVCKVIESVVFFLSAYTGGVVCLCEQCHARMKDSGMDRDEWLHHEIASQN